MIQAIHLKGGAGHVPDNGKQREHDVVSNVFLPGMYRDGGVRLHLCAPPDEISITAEPSDRHLPGSFEQRLPVFVYRKRQQT